MKLKLVSTLLAAFFCIILFYSCNLNNNDDETYTFYSSDAQIYSFALSATVNNNKDSLAYAQLAKAKFVINQADRRIYNPDSLLYKTDINNKLFATLGFGPTGSPAGIELVYSDTTITWSTSDSIDFSKPLKIKVTAYRANTAEYTIDLRIHKVDPDTLQWQKKTALPRTGEQKTLLKDNQFYSYISNGGQINLYTSARTTLNWISVALAGLPATVNIPTISELNGLFLAADNSGNTYSSTDGISWSGHGNNGVVSVLGILPGTTILQDSMLVVVRKGSNYQFAKTNDMDNFRVIDKVRGIVGTVSNISDVYPKFPKTGFAHSTRYNRTTLGQNSLLLTGGTDYLGELSNRTWLIHSGTSGLEISYIEGNTVLKAKNNISSCLYDDLLYVYSGGKFYSSTWGGKWTEVKKAVKAPLMPLVQGSDLIVDSDNYIWVFGGVSEATSTYYNEVWCGRMNKFNK